MEVEWKQSGIGSHSGNKVELKWNQSGSKVEASGYNGITMEVEWKCVSRVEVEWNQNGTRVEVNFQNGNTVEGSGPYKPPQQSLEAANFLADAG